MKTDRDLVDHSINQSLDHSIDQSLDHSSSCNTTHKITHTSSPDFEDDLDYAEILDEGEEGEGVEAAREEDERKGALVDESSDVIVEDDGDRKEEEKDLPVFYDVPTSHVYTSPLKQGQ